MRIVKLTKETTKNILENMLKRSPSQYGEYESRVQAIIQNIKENGDEALFSYTKQFDKADINASNVKVTDEEFEEAYKAVDPALLDVIRKALVNIESYHELQKQNSWFKSTPQGTMLGQKVTPLEKVGVYVPGGKAVYPSSVLMNIMPAKVAGVDKIIMTTPCNAEGKVNPAVLVAAKEAGADEVYKAGGAQAIAALAFGTESIPKVDKIVGPGNIYVALAKKAVYGHVSIDSIAGPSESWLWQMRQLIRDMLRQTCFPRQSMMSSLPQFLLRQVKSWHMRYPISRWFLKRTFKSRDHFQISG